MNRRTAILLMAPILPIMLQGCIARTAVDVVTAPVRVAGKAVDLATTSQSEADEKRGRALRRDEERFARLERRHDALARECEAGDSDACAQRDDAAREMDGLRRQLRAE